MSKKIKKPTTCEKHLLILDPLSKQCYFHQKITCLYCNQDQQHTLNHPIFNKDAKYNSPAFILPQEKEETQALLKKWSESHDKKVKDYAQQKSSNTQSLEIYQPKPKSKNSFCNVCKQNYEDYLKHIKSNKHKKKIQSSLFQKYIIEIGKSFSCQFESKEILNTPTDIGGEQQLQCQPRKKHKFESQTCLSICNYPANQQLFQENLHISSTLHCKIPLRFISPKIQLNFPFIKPLPKSNQ